MQEIYSIFLLYYLQRFIYSTSVYVFITLCCEIYNNYVFLVEFWRIFVVFLTSLWYNLQQLGLTKLRRIVNRFDACRLNTVSIK